jgi:NadR type nicotinamide-nucleotide adenylyltransferase
MSASSPRIGLTLGKFAPLHRGHQLMIETALDEVDHLIIVIYDSPKVTAVPLPVRVAWLRHLYPTVQVVEAWNGPNEVGNTPEIQELHERYIIEHLQIRGITHFYSSEFYGDHMSRALGAVNRQIDPARQLRPYSGTRIRADPYGQRDGLHPFVYRDLIANIVFLGAPATGKTTIAERMARELDTVWMPEYGREFWEAHQVERRLTPEQLVTIAEGHLEREEQLLVRANRYLFTDTNALTTYMFALAYHGAAAKQLHDLALAAASRYDLVFVCDTDIPYDDTWDRSGDANRAVFQKQILADLHMRRLPYFLLTGDLETRVVAVKRVLSAFTKYQNPIDLGMALRREPDADEGAIP